MTDVKIYKFDITQPSIRDTGKRFGIKIHQM